MQTITQTLRINTFGFTPLAALRGGPRAGTMSNFHQQQEFMPSTGLRFLVVEDHAFQRSVLARLLQSMGAGEVHTAEDGRAALEIVRDPGRPVDIVISDLSMPGMDGMELVRRLSELGAPVSLIVASALDQNLLAIVGNMARGYQVRILGVIGKPPTAAKLVPLIEMHRELAAHTHTQAAGVPIDEIATSWTSHDLDPWYLPAIDIATGALRCLTATPRWRHPDRGILAPEAFMPSIQARGLLDEFAWTVLQEAAGRCAAWRARGLDAKVAIPLLFGSYDDVSRAHRITEIVRGAGLEPGQAMLLAQPAPLKTQARAAPVLENLARLRMDGFLLALEYPGEAVQSIDPVMLGAFTHLRVPATLLSMPAGEGLDAVLRTASQAGLRVVVEGLEQPEHLHALRMCGAELAEGPAVGPVLAADSILEWERDRRIAARRSEAAPR
jgi:EAL domain-containing protein (putative c-di-GMP-specific phosphodiesterase class I)